MRVVTWNLNGLDDTDLDVRTEAAVMEALLGGPPERVLLGEGPPAELPDVLLFQEVVERSYVAHLSPHLSAAGYRLYPPRIPQRSYFEVIAVREPHRIESAVTRDLPLSGQGRQLLEVRLEGGVRLYTAHLESLRVGAPSRRMQAAHVAEILRAAPGLAIFGGDTNLRESEVPALDGLCDAWEATGRVPEDRATWGAHARYDRVWIAGGTAESFSLLGQTSGHWGSVPSDHVGLEVDVVAG